MFEPIDDAHAEDVRRWQAPSFGSDAGMGAGAGRAVGEGEDVGTDAGMSSTMGEGRLPGSAMTGVDPASDRADAGLRAATDEAALQARFDDGWARGLSEGRAAANAASHGAVIALIADLTRERDRRDTQLEDELLALARAMARLILRRELEHDVGAMQTLVRAALAQLPAAAETPVVALHPDDAAALADLMTPAEAERLVADPSLARGGCRVELGDSFVDAGIDAWVARLVSSDGRLEPLDATPSSSTGS